MTFIFGILKIIILLGTLVTIHELGHFLVAKACNIKVHKFAIGFGPKIVSKVKGETEYAIRAIPFGGFVQMEGEDVASDDERAFNKKPVWQRLLVVAAGATVNILFAFLLYILVTMNVNIYMLPIVDKIDDTSIAYTTGLREADIIKKIDGKEISFANQISSYISESKNTEITFTIERENKYQDLVINIPEKRIGYIGAAFSEDGEIVYMQDGAPAKESNLHEGDKIISINGKEFAQVDSLVEEIKNNAGNTLEIIIERNDIEEKINIRPQEKVVRVFDANYKIISGKNFFENSYYAIKEAKYYFSETIKAFLKLFAGKAENASVMGPVGIAGQITKTEGFIEFFYLMSAISFSLGICNLLPIPGLDGGKILFLIIEMIRRKPLNQKTEIAAQLAGFAVIIGIALLVTVKDIINMF